MIPLVFFVTISLFLFCVGIFGVLSRRNVVGALMSIELILNAANINLVAFNRYLGPSDGLGQIFALFVVAISAAESVVGLVMVITIYRNAKTIFLDKFNLMKG
ncbi:MAG TPA: NADH-quinone oxidoreductase subunit NuoK [Candidatus Omnitrophica bacterium]|nr:MAG: NADH-quinone oxidoreductase subunit K [Omnitrophica WOR_2 bacterium GWA2_45_18]HBR14788.1 NADH-quinone oxidoreductase subunit NuoK [Candidatus Omnitrophota bacterium]